MFKLQLLHASDLEINIGNLDDIPNFAGVLSALEDGEGLSPGDAADVNTIKLFNGTSFVPGPVFDASQEIYGPGGAVGIQLFNELDIDAATIGPHTFDAGPGAVNDILDFPTSGPPDLPPFSGANFPFVNANINVPPGSPLADDVVPDSGFASSSPGKLTHSTVVFAPNGSPIGIVGVNSPFLGDRTHIGGLEILPEKGPPKRKMLGKITKLVQNEVDELLNDHAAFGLDKVILLDSGLPPGFGGDHLAPLLSDVDIILGNNPLIGPTGGGIRIIDDVNDNPTAVVESSTQFRYVGRLVIDFDDDGNILPDSIDNKVSFNWATSNPSDEARESEVWAAAKALVDEVTKNVEIQQDNTFGSSDVFLEGRNPFRPDQGVQNQETNLGNLVSDAGLDVAQAYDGKVMGAMIPALGFYSGIGEDTIRNNGTRKTGPTEAIPGVKKAGQISEADIDNALGFNLGLSIVRLKTGELIDLFETAIDNTDQPFFPQVSGIRFGFDPGQPPGSRIQDFVFVDDNGEIVQTVIRNGETVVGDKKVFRLVTTEFIADSDLFDLPGRKRVDLTDENEVGPFVDDTFDPGTPQDALAEYLLENFPNRKNAFDGRDTGQGLDGRIQNLDERDDTVRSQIQNVLTGNNKDNDIIGTMANDRIKARGGDDTVHGSVGSDLILGNGGSDRLFGGLDDDKVNGGAGNDRIFGEDGDDILIGGGGNDRIVGGPGDDVITGGRGTDNILGGPGSDRFDFNSIRDSGPGPKKSDNIRGFSHGDDIIDVSGIDAKKGKGNQSFDFIGRNDFTDTRGELRVEKVKPKKFIVEGDIDGDGNADFSIDVFGTKMLGVNDFDL